MCSSELLPLGLKPYSQDEFDRQHAAGAMKVTASGVAELFGLGWHGRYAYALHLAGREPLPDADSKMTRRGTILQDVVAQMLAEDTGREVKRIHAYADHPTVPLSASPDALITVGTELGDAELKVIAKPVFEAEWDGRPPLKYLLQKQAQFACTGATVGTIAVLVIGAFEFDLHHWDIEPHGGTIDRILSETDSLVSDLRAGRMPDPDLAGEKDRAAFLSLSRYVEPGKLIKVSGDDVIALADDYKAAQIAAKAAKARQDEAKARLIAMIGDAERADLDDGRSIRTKEITRAAYQVAAATYRDFRIIGAK